MGAEDQRLLNKFVPRRQIRRYYVITSLRPHYSTTTTTDINTVTASNNLDIFFFPLVILHSFHRHQEQPPIAIMVASDVQLPPTDKQLLKEQKQFERLLKAAKTGAERAESLLSGGGAGLSGGAGLPSIVDSALADEVLNDRSVRLLPLPSSRRRGRGTRQKTEGGLSVSTTEQVVDVSSREQVVGESIGAAGAAPWSSEQAGAGRTEHDRGGTTTVGGVEQEAQAVAPGGTSTSEGGVTIAVAGEDAPDAPPAETTPGHTRKERILAKNAENKAYINDRARFLMLKKRRALLQEKLQAVGDRRQEEPGSLADSADHPDPPIDHAAGATTVRPSASSRSWRGGSFSRADMLYQISISGERLHDSWNTTIPGPPSLLPPTSPPPPPLLPTFPHDSWTHYHDKRFTLLQPVDHDGATDHTPADRAGEALVLALLKSAPTLKNLDLGTLGTMFPDFDSANVLERVIEAFGARACLRESRNAGHEPRTGFVSDNYFWSKSGWRAGGGKTTGMGGSTGRSRTDAGFYPGYNKQSPAALVGEAGLPLEVPTTSGTTHTSFSRGGHTTKTNTLGCFPALRHVHLPSVGLSSVRLARLLDIFCSGGESRSGSGDSVMETLVLDGNRLSWDSDIYTMLR